MSTTKISRQLKIKEIISTQEIGSQEELAEILLSNNFETTQATLSRDLHELGIVRIPVENGFKYVFHKGAMEQSLQPLMGIEIINIFHNESSIVVKTMAGRAQGVAAHLDRMLEKQIIGTVAGDDTIIVIPDSHDNIKIIVDNIRKLAG